MKKELQDNLAEEFEFMRRKPVPADGVIANLYDAFGLDTGDGWYQLLYDMCKEIAEVLETAEKPVHIVVDQIKEKYGTLRFYYHFEGAEPEIQAVDFIPADNETKSEGPWRMSRGSNTPQLCCASSLIPRQLAAGYLIGSGSMRIMPGRDDVHQKISEIVQKYENKSGEVCETCGCEGTVRTDLRWIQTLCDTCYSKCIEKVKKK